MGKETPEMKKFLCVLLTALLLLPAVVGCSDQNKESSDPASNGEVCLRAYEKTGDEFFLRGANNMLEYLLLRAPRTEDGIICHNDVSFFEGFTKYQLWID